MRKWIAVAGVAAGALGFVVGRQTAPRHDETCLPMRYWMDCIDDCQTCESERVTAVGLCQFKGGWCMDMEGVRHDRCHPRKH